MEAQPNESGFQLLSPLSPDVMTSPDYDSPKPFLEETHISRSFTFPDFQQKRNDFDTPNNLAFLDIKKSTEEDPRYEELFKVLNSLKLALPK